MQSTELTVKNSKKNYSIQRRLLMSLLFGLPILWLTVTLSISWQIWQEMNEINDTQITQVARYLLGTSQIYDIDNKAGDVNLPSYQPKILALNSNLLEDLELGEAEEDYMGFAVWDKQGRLLLADENGEQFDFLPNQHGFLEKDNDDYQSLNPFSREWRLFYVHDDKGSHVIAVGQNLHSRQEMIIDALSVQIIPALTGLILFLGFAFWSIRRGLAPLNLISKQLSYRNPLDDSPLQVIAPKEVKPLVNELNQLFVKVADTLAREQRFTADASHELRSPLAALKLQADVLEQQILQTDLAEQQQDQLFYHTQQIGVGIDRANHLVEQLLILAKLAPQQGLTADQLQTIDWLNLTDMVLSDVNRNAREKHSQLKRDVFCDNSVNILPLQGNVTLLSLLLRNLLDNAIRYCPAHSIITLQLYDNKIRVIDNGHGVAPNDLARLSERFFRPAGQSERGSGLGLSIVKRIADLHGLKLTMANRIENGNIIGFMVEITR